MPDKKTKAASGAIEKHTSASIPMPATNPAPEHTQKLSHKSGSKPTPPASTPTSFTDPARERAQKPSRKSGSKSTPASSTNPTPKRTQKSPRKSGLKSTLPGPSETNLQPTPKSTTKSTSRAATNASADPTAKQTSKTVTKESNPRQALQRASKLTTKSLKSYDIYPSHHDAVSDLLEEDNLFFDFHNVDESSCEKKHTTTIKGCFKCVDGGCATNGWSSLSIAITIRMYPGAQYNARVYGQRCKACGGLGELQLDDSYASRVAYRLKVWCGVPMQPPPYSGRSRTPHERDLCEGCKHGCCPDSMMETPSNLVLYAPSTRSAPNVLYSPPSDYTVSNYRRGKRG